MIRRFKSLVEGHLSGGCAVIQGIQEKKKAFRQVPIHDDSFQFCVIAVWNPFPNVCHAFRFDVGGSPIKQGFRVLGCSGNALFWASNLRFL